MLKSALRKQALQQRNALTRAQANALNEALLTQFTSIDFTHINSVHIYLPIVKHNEPNTFLLIDWLKKNHPEIVIVVPKSNFETHTISNYIYQGKADLKENQYQIPEPQQAKPFLGMPDMIIVPLLAFDKNGYRVGYGKGFYDRFLQNSQAQKIGLSFFEAIPKITDVHLNDVRLDKCITPTKIINFN
jgi:5-formyltetrahydrofolate cyclo-ligase